MGKKKHTHGEVSSQRTLDLGIPDLLVFESEGTGNSYHAVHKRYFCDDKSTCPVCGSTKTRTSKVITRKLKDILRKENNSTEIIDLYVYQRYLRCDGCKDSVFPEDFSFAEKGCRYTNRLSDALAEGTFRNSFKKVCIYYGVPASTASVGAIMRRRILYRESLLASIKTPKVLCVFEVAFNGNIYPIALGLWDNEIYCLDILESNDEDSYIKFFKTLDATCVDTVCIDPEGSLRSAVAICFPMASVVVTGECISRFARNALLDIIQKDGKRFPLRHKDTQLTLQKKYLTDAHLKKQIVEGMKIRPRLKAAYDSYQKLFCLFEEKWSYKELAAWVGELPESLKEFSDLADMIAFYKIEVEAFLETANPPPEIYTTSVQAVCDAIKTMPNCIFDVLRARCMLTLAHDTVEVGGEVMRLGIRVDRLTKNMIEIADNIKEEREYGLD